MNDPHMASALYKAAVEAVQEWGELTGKDTSDVILQLDVAEARADYTYLQDMRDLFERLTKRRRFGARRP